MRNDSEPLQVRPYQLLSIIAKVGAGHFDDLEDDTLNRILWEIRRNPQIPVTLCCNVSSIYRYQNPGHKHDTQEGKLFNTERDLDILQRLGLVPGSTRPAEELLQRVLENIPTLAGIAGLVLGFRLPARYVPVDDLVAQWR